MTISIVRWLAFFAFLSISAFASAAEELDCKSPQDAFAKAVCSDQGLKVNLPLIAAKVAPNKAMLPWLKSISDDCNTDARCISTKLLTEWLKFTATALKTQQTYDKTIEKLSCNSFKELLKDELSHSHHKLRSRNQSSSLPQEVVPLDASDAEYSI